MINRNKISVIGAGNTGATLAFLLAQKEVGDVVIVDQPKFEGMSKGKALDIQESGPVLGFNSVVTGTSNYEDISDSDIVIITAGVPRKPGMSRDDLVQINESIMEDISQQIVRYCPQAFVIVLTNPVDAMTYTVLQSTGFEKNKVMGQSGILDTARYKTFIAEALHLSVQDITGLVLGGHGNTMVPIVSSTQVNGVPITELLSPSELEYIIQRTRDGGAEIVNLLGNGSAYYAPAAALYEMVIAILKDQKRVLPTIAFLDGEYGYRDICLGVPTVLGKQGVERVIELKLSESEQQQLDLSADAVMKVKQSLKQAK
ncbi:malate dehydrogenase [Staphylococcus lugdunensis]|jgi:malate dehydrogenase|uniref:Malate dehydrogenase n=1 Tax=Staphylococcus lugdunensis TaxID=28035 RepID=A0ABD4ED78_STALU|nr:malate dehydrogenase [Staphylococcus lugdunensis]EFU84411.1 malate dehydrogenase, NAD-dependent [Staphylococcus lugdunensis M23590]KAK57118.1 malate dehydrogenase, NAD-dependent [Staphylococcus lugdunensis VCU150]OFJ64982.1 malate dehydrogenase [Staphylococcus sp. HMSC077E11]OFM42517.1 malate dehydrogenase [Staphylococcus sp. HMSC077E12]OFR90225.1 malate dehydrogenase [Staphylococcus sp. HMSC059F04]OHQ49044.1 malate dehydrogenase [Staphylococcus sp. HMSC070D07]